MDRDSAVALAQQAILRSNCRLIDAVERAQAAARLEALLARTEPEAPGLLSLHPGVDLNCAASLTRAFAGCSGVVLYTTANTSSAGRITNHGNDPRGGRAVVMRQVMAALAALRANPSVQQVITLIFPTDKVTGITDPDFMVNWIDVRDVGQWVGTCFDYPDIFRNQNLHLASCAHTGHELVEIAERCNRHGTRFRYRQFPLWLMRILARFSEEVVYPLRYAEWYHARGNGYDFASEADLAHLDRIHPRWTFERELEFWGINDLKPRRGGR